MKLWARFSIGIKLTKSEEDVFIKKIMKININLKK